MPRPRAYLFAALVLLAAPACAAGGAAPAPIAAPAARDSTAVANAAGGVGAGISAGRIDVSPEVSLAGQKGGGETRGDRSPVTITNNSADWVATVAAALNTGWGHLLLFVAAVMIVRALNSLSGEVKSLPTRLLELCRHLGPPRPPSAAVAALCLFGFALP